MFKTATIACAVAVACASNVHPREHYEKEFFEHIAKFNVEIKDGAEFLNRLNMQIVRIAPLG